MGFDGWDRFEPLAGGRNGASLAWKDGIAYVVKVYPSDHGLRGARERAALHALAGAAGTPSLLAEASDPPCVVMSYLDGSGSLADALLGADPRLAGEALLHWAEALGALHAASTSDTRVAFTEALAERAPELEPRSGRRFRGRRAAVRCCAGGTWAAAAPAGHRRPPHAAVEVEGPTPGGLEPG